MSKSGLILSTYNLMGVYVSAIYNEKHNYKEADKMERYGYIRVSAKDQNPEGHIW